MGTSNREIAEKMHQQDSSYQININLNITLPKGWFVREWYNRWNTVDGSFFYRYPSQTCVCQLESSETAESAIGEGASLEEALKKAIEKIKESEQLTLSCSS